MRMITYRLKTLENGLRLATAPMPHMTSVSVGFWIAVGGRYESEAESGVSHFIEHMLFKGTSRRSAREISEAVEGVGGYLNAFTSEEHTCYYSRARHDRFDLLLDVLADMMLRSQFDPTEIEKERGVIHEEIAMSLDQPHQLVQEVLNEVSWPNQALGRPLTGTGQTVGRLGRNALRRHHRHHYIGAGTVIAVAGRFSAAAVERAVRRVARRFKPGMPRLFPAARASQVAPEVRVVIRRVEQTQLALGLRTCSRHDPRRFALRLLNIILGENMSSRLFQVVREDRGLAYSIYSTLSNFADVGDLVISAGLETANLRRVLGLVGVELRRLKDRAPGRREFDRALDYALGQLDLSLENSEAQMLSLGEQALGYGRVFSPARVRARLGRVRREDLPEAARAFFRPDHVNLAVVGPRPPSADLLGPFRDL